jgi:hypothetical protein
VAGNVLRVDGRELAIQIDPEAWQKPFMSSTGTTQQLSLPGMSVAGSAKPRPPAVFSALANRCVTDPLRIRTRGRRHQCSVNGAWGVSPFVYISSKTERSFFGVRHDGAGFIRDATYQSGANPLCENTDG